MSLVIERPGERGRPGAGIRIGLVNNMPDTALAATEAQFAALLGAAAAEHPVRLRLSCLPEVPRGAQALEGMHTRYFRLEELLAGRLDALIVTGTEPRTAALEEEPYWGSMLGLIEWAEEHVKTSIWSCLAAHALAQAVAGVRRKRLPEKRFGIYRLQDLATDGLLRGLRGPLVMPHSRWNDLPAATLRDAGFRVLSASEACGVDLFVRDGRSLMVCFQGHPEYDRAALLKEYRRDVGRYLRGERPDWPAPPERYFSDDGLECIARYRKRVEARRDPQLFEEFPTAALAGDVAAPWRESAIRVYRNWLEQLSVARLDRKTAADVQV